MGFIDKLFGSKQPGKKEAIQAGQTFELVTGYKPVFRDWRGEIYESLLVRAAIDARSRHIAKCKPKFYGTAKPDLSRKLERRPNPWSTWSQFLYRVNTILDATTNCVIVPIYDDDLNKIGIYPLLPNRCKVIEYKNELWLKYKFMDDRRVGACKLSECAILNKFQFKSDFFGSGNEPLDETMDLISIENQGIKNAIKNSGVYRFIARYNNFALDDDLNSEQTNFTERNFGPEAKNGGILLFPNVYEDIKQIDYKAYQVDKEQRELIEQNVYCYFGVNIEILQNKAIGDAWSSFYEGAVEPFAIQFSETMTAAIYSDNEIARGSGVMLTANRLQYLSNSDKLAVSEKMADRGLMTINEIRDIWNLDPVEGGDQFVRRGEYYTEDPAAGGGNDPDTSNK